MEPLVLGFFLINKTEMTTVSWGIRGVHIEESWLEE